MTKCKITKVSGVTFEKAHWLNEEQKKIKQEIMEGLMNTMFTALNAHKDKFDGATIGDLIISCVLMFSREMLTNLIHNSNIQDQKDDFLDEICIILKKEVLERVQECEKMDERIHG